eukprot:1631115-Pyramimonas_sp.AAC.1
MSTLRSAHSSGALSASRIRLSANSSWGLLRMEALCDTRHACDGETRWVQPKSWVRYVSLCSQKPMLDSRRSAKPSWW